VLFPVRDCNSIVLCSLSVVLAELRVSLVRHRVRRLLSAPKILGSWTSIDRHKRTCETRNTACGRYTTLYTLYSFLVELRVCVVGPVKAGFGHFKDIDDS